ncbi:hypothetical protein EMCG_09720 [[Emmonsia] crescens]|uniref:Rhodopsin domain-containing protein n=1 Tax=[Emmonsia] crescens TaxID=73230 RepID=A0A0G2I1P1_9EURO|nr:hypothetical protein EMCG_09720 [Emmonsia crescens UAMH 3008]
MYSSNPPDALTRWDVIPTLLVSWWCTGFSLAIIFVRVLGRYIRTQVLFPEDWVMLISVIPLLIRMGLVHLVLIYGTNNIISANLSDIQIRRREIGSGLVLGARIFYALFIWAAKFTIAEFLTRLTAQTWRRSFQLMLNFIRFFLVVTFVAVVISTLTECQPFHSYWQVNPTPAPKCRQGYAHLVAMGACDAVTDILLIAFPIPIIIASTMPTRRKFSLTLLFALSLILVVMTCYRVPAVIERHGNQQYRSLFASLEILVATAVSNAIVIGSFMRDRGVKKQKYKIGSVSEASDHKFSRQATITHHQWGSDADLATDVGIRLDPEVKTPTFQEIRPAPLAHSNKGNPEKNGLTESKVAAYHVLEHDEDPALDGGSQKFSSFDPLGPVSNTPECIASDTISNISPKQSPKLCLNDVGGLLASRQSSAATASTCVAHGPPFIPAPEPRLQRPQPSRRSRNFLEAVTNIISPSPRNSGSATSRPIGTTSSGQRGQSRESIATRPARGDEDRTETGTIEQARLQLNDLGDLLNRERRQ